MLRCLATTMQVPTIERAMELGAEAAAYVSSKFVRPVKLEFEKVCMRSLPCCTCNLKAMLCVAMPGTCK